MNVGPSIRVRPGGTLYRYIAREMVVPVLIALGGLTVVVLTRDLLGYSDLVINRGLGAGAVLWIAFYNTVPLLAQMLPFSVLVGSLVALGRLGADRELLALEASGVSARRLVGPVLVFALAMTAVGYALTLLAAPVASRALNAAIQDLARQSPGAVVRAGVVNRIGHWRLDAREVSADGTRLRSVILYIPSVGETIFALRGQLEKNDAGSPRLRLEQGAVIPDPRTRPRLIRFDGLWVDMPEEAAEPVLNEDERLAAAGLSELAARARSSEIDEVDARDAHIAFHRRLALPSATLVFGFLVLPLFLTRAQFSRGGGAMLGVLAILFYYGLVQLGNGFIQARSLPIAAGVWLPDAALGLLALGLFANLHRTTSFGRHLERPEPRLAHWLEALRLLVGSRLDRGSSAESASAGGPPRVHRFALGRYVSSRFFQMAILCFAVLVLAYLVVDMLERLQWFAKYGATPAQALRFYGLRIPLLASRVVPMALLVATALTVGLLAVQGELTAIRSCGIPAPRALLPVLVISAAVVPLSFFLNNDVVPETNAKADYLKNTEIKKRTDSSDVDLDVWYRRGQHFYQAESLDPQLGSARNITVYELGEDGLPRSRADARAARHIGGGVWRLEDPVRVEVVGEGLREVPAAPFADLGEDLPAEVDTMHLSVGELLSEIREVEESGYDATIYEVDYFVKLASPFACIVLPALALFFCVSGPPYPSSALSLVLSAGTAVAYTLLTGIGASLGYGGVLPPAVAGWGPTAAFALLTLYFGLRLRRFWSA
jgi:lipopolysaccharide export system permease protein